MSNGICESRHLVLDLLAVIVYEGALATTTAIGQLQ